MAHNTTVFRQLLDLLPRHEFDAEARQHQEGQRLRVMSRWAQFVALGLGQLGGLQSLRDIVGNLRAQPHKLYHLGVRAFVSRSSLARVNAQQPYTLYEALFGRLLARCQQRAPRHGFRFKNKLYAVDASTIDLCLAAFPWASFRRTKGAIKLHVGVDQAGHLPTFISVTDGKTGDVTVARTWTFPAGSVVVADRAYLDFGWLHQLQQRGVTFVTRLKRNVRYQVVREHDVDIRTGVLSDQTIELTSARSRKAYPGTLRRVGYWDEETRRSYVFVTNNTTWIPTTGQALTERRPRRMGRPDRRDGQPSGTVGRYLLPTGRRPASMGQAGLWQGGHAHAGTRARGASLAGSPNHRQRNVRRGCPFQTRPARDCRQRGTRALHGPTVEQPTPDWR